MTAAERSALVLGEGNILLQDEGLGVRAVEALQQRYRLPPGLDAVDGGTSGMDLLDAVADRALLIILDAVKTGAPPGTLVTLHGEAVPALFRNKISPHQLGISDLLGALALLERSPRQLVLLGVVPVCMDTGLELTAPVAAQIDQLVELTVAELEGHGWRLSPQAVRAAG